MTDREAGLKEEPESIVAQQEESRYCIAWLMQKGIPQGKQNARRYLQPSSYLRDGAGVYNEEPGFHDIVTDGQYFPLLGEDSGSK